ncbi:hypothetical protein ACHAPJ_012810 [Fusarium lateritium]
MDQQQPITAEWCQKMEKRIKWLKYLGVMDKIDLHRGPDGLPRYDGMPLEHDTFLAPPADIPAATAPTAVGVPASQSPSDPSIRISSGLFKRIVGDLQSRHPYSHVAWPLAIVKLQMMHDSTPTIAHVLNVLQSAMEACESDIDALTALSASDPATLVTTVVTTDNLRTWLAPLQCRLIGIQSGLTSSVTWWNEHGKSAVARFNDESLRQCLNSTDYALCKAYTRHSIPSLPGPTHRTLAEEALSHVKRFLEVQRNQDVLAKIEHHIDQLEAEMQEAEDEQTADEEEYVEF